MENPPRSSLHHNWLCLLNQPWCFSSSCRSKSMLNMFQACKLRGWFLYIPDSSWVYEEMAFLLPWEKWGFSLLISRNTPRKQTYIHHGCSWDYLSEISLACFYSKVPTSSGAPDTCCMFLQHSCNKLKETKAFIAQSILSHKVCAIFPPKREIVDSCLLELMNW